RLLEIASLCDRATVLRDGATVGVLDIVEGAEDRIVELMLGPEPEGEAQDPRTESKAIARRSIPADATPRLPLHKLKVGSAVDDVSFGLHAGEVLGLVALEGQGQDQLFEALAGSRRADGGELRLDGRPVRFGHPADAIAAGIVYVPANRVEALLLQR